MSDNVSESDGCEPYKTTFFFRDKLGKVRSVCLHVNDPSEQDVLSPEGHTTRQSECSWLREARHSGLTSLTIGDFLRMRNPREGVLICLVVLFLVFRTRPQLNLMNVSVYFSQLNQLFSPNYLFHSRVRF